MLQLHNINIYQNIYI